MPFPGLISLGFTAKEDSKYLTETPNNPVIRGEYEGGYVVTRPRYTRAPTNKITTGFTDISNADKVIFFNYYAAMRGGSNSFTYNHPVSGEAMTVRFGETPPVAKYAGMGTNFRWDIADIDLEQV